MATELDLTKIGLIIEFANKGLGTLNCETEMHTSYLLEEGNRVDITVKSVSYCKSDQVEHDRRGIVYNHLW